MKQISKTSLKLILVLTCLASWSGCTSTNIRTISSVTLPFNKVDIEYGGEQVMPNRELLIFKNEVQAAILRRGVTNDKDAEYRVDTVVLAYKMRDGTSRALLGALAGTDKLITTVEVFDKQSNQSVGSTIIETRNFTAVGSISGFMEQHAEKIADFLSGRADS